MGWWRDLSAPWQPLPCPCPLPPLTACENTAEKKRTINLASSIYSLFNLMSKIRLFTCRLQKNYTYVRGEALSSTQWTFVFLTSLSQMFVDKEQTTWFAYWWSNCNISSNYNFFLFFILTDAITQASNKSTVKGMVMVLWSNCSFIVRKGWRRAIRDFVGRTCFTWLRHVLLICSYWLWL